MPKHYRKRTDVDWSTLWVSKLNWYPWTLGLSFKGLSDDHLLIVLVLLQEDVTAEHQNQVFFENTHFMNKLTAAYHEHTQYSSARSFRWVREYGQQLTLQPLTKAMSIESPWLLLCVWSNSLWWLSWTTYWQGDHECPRMVDLLPHRWFKIPCCWPWYYHSMWQLFMWHVCMERAVIWA